MEQEAKKASYDEEEEEEEEEEEDDNIYKKLEQDIHKQYLVDFHPEINQININELMAASKIVRDNQGKIIDPLHKTIPFITKYERTRILGIRANQLK